MEKTEVDKIIPQLKGYSKDELSRIRNYLLVCEDYKRVKDYKTGKIYRVPIKEIWLHTFKMKDIKNYPEEKEVT